MPVPSAHPLVRFLRDAVAVRGAGDVPDHMLLDRFTADRDETAFAALVRRHGPTVFGVCQRLLHHEQDAEDAFQATFLVLVRRAGSIAKRESVGSWLYGVACRVARKVRASTARRATAAADCNELPAPESADLVWRELRPLLDEELSRLPAKYRGPVVLCYLGGKTTEQAARELGCARGTVLSRLARARQRLRSRLARRGLTLSVGTLVASLASPDVEAALPAALVDSTIKYAAAGAAERTVVCPAGVLAEGVIRTMSVTRIRELSIAVILLVAAGLGLGAFAWPTPAAGTDAAPLPVAPRLTPRNDAAREREQLQGAWMGAPHGYIPSLIFAGDRLTIDGPNKRSEATYRLDPSHNPKHLDICLGDAREPTIFGIYRIDGDKLTYCWTHGTDRPVEFKEAPEHYLHKFQRKPADKDEQKTTEPDEKLRAARREIGGQLFRLTFAMYRYHDEHDHFPRAAIAGKDGKPLLSWRVALLPYLGREDLYKEFHLDEPWDSAHNKKLIPRMPTAFAAVGAKPAEPGTTFLQVFSGTGTVFEEGMDIRIADITDGTVTTILVAESAKGVPWTKPVDMPFDMTKPLPELGGGMLDDGLFSFVFADGSVRVVKRGTGEKFLELMRLLIRRDDGAIVDLGELDR